MENGWADLVYAMWGHCVSGEGNSICENMRL